MKNCSKCKELLEESKFYLMGKYLSSMCKACYTTYSRERYKKVPIGLVDLNLLKVCSKCKQEKSQSRFHKSLGKSLTVRPYCKECTKRQQKVYYKKNKLKCVERRKKWEIKNRKRYLEIKLYSQRKRNLLKKGVTKLLTRKELSEIRSSYSNLCVYCLKPAEANEHIIPICSGGQDTLDNVVPVCTSCNSSKQGKVMMLWLFEMVS